MADLYPDILPFETGQLDVGDGHRLYYEVSGCASGQPALFLHGGPGAGASRSHARFFDPERTRIVLFDQRGVGKSEPHASEFAGLRCNSTPHLVADIERLCEHLDIERALVVGGSWGSTLALAHASAHPERVAGLALRGVTTFRSSELDWFFRSGAHALFPDAHEAFMALFEPSERADPARALARRVLDPDPAVHGPAARALRCWEQRLAASLSSAGRVYGDTTTQGPIGRHALGMARLEVLYSCFGGFLQRPLLEAVDACRHLPLYIVQGRFDCVCPPRTAWELHRRWPGSELRLVSAGHGMFEEPVASALVDATDALVRGAARGR